jgi:hypothetical protein
MGISPDYAISSKKAWALNSAKVGGPVTVTGFWRVYCVDLVLRVGSCLRDKQGLPGDSVVLLLGFDFRSLAMIGAGWRLYIPNILSPASEKF